MSEQPWGEAVITEVAVVLGDTDTGLTGGQIGGLLARLRIADPSPAASKRVRLADALITRQARDGNPQRIITFINAAMEPVAYRDRPELFTLRRDRLNERLAFVGLRVNDEGKVARGRQVSTLDEATRVATSLRDELRRRATHPEVLRYCTIEILKKAHFHACLEATKSILDRLRDLTGAAGDGADLVDETLALGKSGVPRLAINTLRTRTERDEQTGLVNLIKGLIGLYRNPTAHDPRLRRPMSEAELLEVLTMISMVQRRLDDAAVVAAPEE
ncbi:TIGR02391 family protein [Branchiibius cervicis]|uniref:TIGR02391 family protein n=1 Tax=Branchiibius cervicis TaxID=908252 RepID=A0ABW2AVK5_9MICO